MSPFHQWQIQVRPRGPLSHRFPGDNLAWQQPGGRGGSHQPDEAEESVRSGSVQQRRAEGAPRAGPVHQPQVCGSTLQVLLLTLMAPSGLEAAAPVSDLLLTCQ